MTSLYGIIRGRPPKFFDGNAEAFSGLHFNVDREEFAFFSPLKMKDDPLWIDVTELMQKGLGAFMPRFMGKPEFEPAVSVFDRLNAIFSIRDIDLHIEEVTGEDKTVDLVVDIFNRVNSGGTKLSKGDLALAKICAEWPDARDEMKKRLDKWRRGRLSLQARAAAALHHDHPDRRGVFAKLATWTRRGSGTASSAPSARSTAS